MSDDDGDAGQRVPLFGSWRVAYAAVIAAFALDVTLFYAISRFFA